jgi:probable F420-dependent oxidoreductase
MQFGLGLPTYAWPDLDLARVDKLKTIVQRAEAVGFDMLWTFEHFVVAPGLYGVSFLSSLTVLSYVAAVTERIRIGPGILIAPLRNPVVLAKEIATLQYLARGRFVLGIGAGWDAHEFEAIGVPLKERGGRTDEMLAALRRLLTEPRVSFRGRYYRFEDVTIEPVLERFPELWIGGGSKLSTSLSPDKSYIAESILRRILAADGWMARGSGDDEMVERDVAEIRRYLAAHGRDPDSLHYSHLNFYWLSSAKDREAALREQRPKIELVMGAHRSFEHLQQCYFLGTTAEIVERIARLRDAGLDSIVVAPLDYDVEQVERFAEEVMPHFKE